MKRHSNKFLLLLAVLTCVLSPRAGAAAAVSEKRLALVIGNAFYKTKPLATAVNDAALIAQTLGSAGFDVKGASDLDQSMLRDVFRDFTNTVARAGPGAVVVVYFSGYGVQLAGENYLIPIGTEISDVADLPGRAASLSELTHALEALKPKSTFIIVDAARPGPFVLPGQAGGLAWTESEPSMLIAFSAAPGTLARDAADGFGPYARALAEMIREGNLGPANLFDRVRLRVHELTGGAQVPWNASKIETQFRFFERTPDAPARTDAPTRIAQFRSQPMRVLGADNAYVVALMRDTFDAYTDFLAEYWQDSKTKRIQALLAARRESITWRRTCQANEPVAYWSYLERYPLGPHAADAGRLLAKMGAATTPPSKFARLDYDVPPPLPDELEYIERPILNLDDPKFGFEAPPPTPANFLEPPPQELVNLKIAAKAPAAHALPTLNLPLQVFLRVPPGAEALPNPSDNAREAWVMRAAVVVPTESEKRSESQSISTPQASNVGNAPANEARPSTPVDDGMTRNENRSPRNEDQEATNEIASRLALLSRSGTPRASLADTEGPAAAPSMFAPAASGLALVPPSQTSLGGSVPIIRSGALVRSQTGLPGEMSAESEALTQTTRTKPTSSPLSTAPALAALSNLSEGTAASRLTSISRTVSAPQWLTDILTVRARGILPGPTTDNGEQPISVPSALSAPSMFASASAGLTFQTWRYAMPSSRNARSATLARPPAGSSEEGSSATILYSQPRTPISRSTPRATLLPAAIGDSSAGSAKRAQPSPVAVEQTKPRKKPLIKPAPSSQAARNPDESQEAPAPNPQ